MRQSIIAAAALLLTAAPALADWGPSRWGMTPEQVVAAVPNAAPVVRSGDGKDVFGHHQLATAPMKDGAFDVQGNFYFSPDKRQLAFIQLVPVVARCPDYMAAQIGRNGAGSREDKNLDKLDMISIRWTDPGSRDQLRFIGVTATINGAWLYCHLQVDKPA
jgi:hypothetical protein